MRRHKGGTRGRPVLRLVGVGSVVAVLVAASLFGAATGTAAAKSPDAQITDITISDRVDADGDGYVSSFEITVEADTDFPEVGGFGKGNPVMKISLQLQNGGGSSVVRRVPVGRDRDGTFRFKITGDDVFDQGGGDTDPIAADPTFSVLSVDLLDKDVLSAESVTSQNYLLVSDPLEIERPSVDERRDVTVTSNVDGADVYVDGTRRGTTPWTGSFAVDHGRRYGETNVEVRKDGYRTASTQVELDSSTVRLPMEKRTKPVVVGSDPDGATVYVDGREVGTTPWAGTFWVKSSHTVRVEKAGYLSQEFTDVSPTRTIRASLVSTDLALTNTTYVSPILFNGSSSSSTTTQDDTQVIDVGSVGSSTITTGGSSVDFATYLPNLVDTTSVLDSAISANVTTAPRTPLSAQTVTFDAADSYSLFGSIDSYTWTFGDGTTARGRLVTHRYDAPGTYDVELTVADADGMRETTQTTVRVGDRQPRAVFVSSRGRVDAGRPVRFDGSGSSDPEGPITRFEWDFGDGTRVVGANVTHSYATAGSYDVALTVTDSGGNTATLTRTLTVRTPNEAPTPSLDASTTTSDAGSRVEFSASNSYDSDGTVEAYGWEFGDGTNATGERVEHAFESAGTYAVKLSVRDDRGVVRTTTTEIDVGAASGSSSNADGETSGATGTVGGNTQASGDVGTTGGRGGGGGPGVPTSVLVGGGVVAMLLGGVALLRR